MINRYRAGFFGLGLATGAALLLAFRRQILTRGLQLRPVDNGVKVTRAIRVAVDADVSLRCDHYWPKTTNPKPGPVILMRTPYSRKESLFAFAAQRFAERGYHVVIQDTRGQFDSEGEFDAFIHESADGQATLHWLTNQSWCNGRIGMWGPSYLGYVQWAAASQASPHLQALFPIFSSSQIGSVTLPDGGLALDLIVRWYYILDGLARANWTWQKLQTFAPGHQERALQAAFLHLPLSEAQAALPREPLPAYAHPLDRLSLNHPFWSETDHGEALDSLESPVHLVGGWYDFFLRETLGDYQRLREAGASPYLTIGPWVHSGLAFIPEVIRMGLDWFDSHLRDDGSRLRQRPVRVFVMGRNEWREYEEWPPPSRLTRLFLRSRGQLAWQPEKEQGGATSYTYDPADPTPSVGGPMIFPPSGPKDNRVLESRPDVLVFTSVILDAPLEILGLLKLNLFATSSLDYTDFTGRLCDVHPDGRSVNICDGFIRLDPQHYARRPDGSWRLDIDLWATAHTFEVGHRLRLQVASGMHPRFMRNLGFGEPVGDARRMAIARQTIYHNHDHPSHLLLPVTS